MGFNHSLTSSSISKSNIFTRLSLIGFSYIFLTGSRKTGQEVFGNKIWWNNLRPIHTILYTLFAYNAINKNREAWIYLFIDVIIGLISFIGYHYMEGNFTKVFT